MIATFQPGPTNYKLDDRFNKSYWKLAVIAIPFILAFAAICYLYIGLGDGHLFNEDYAVYLQQAWNIANHKTMADVGVIQYFDPARPLSNQGPLTYPTLLPLIYALPVSVFGFDIELLKTIQLAMLAAGLILFCYTMHKWRFSAIETSSSVLIFTMSFEIRRSVNSISADLPFILFLLLALLPMHEFVRSDGSKRYWWAILSGIAIFLAIDLRTVGAALLPTLWVADFLVRRRLGLISLAVPTITVAALWVGQWAVGLSGENYGFVLNYRFFTPVENLHEFYWAFAQPLTNSAFPTVATATFLILAALAAIGVLYEAARGMVVAVFIVVYTVLLLALPDFGAGARYLVPQLLVLGAFAIRGVAVIGSLAGLGVRAGQVVTWGTGALGLVWCILTPAPLPSGHWDFGVTSGHAREIFDFIRGEIPADALIAASKSRSFHLFTQRTTIRLPAFGSMEETMAWLQHYRVSHVILKYSAPRSNYDLADCPEQPLCRAGRHDPGIKELFRNSDFVLFEVLSNNG